MRGTNQEKMKAPGPEESSHRGLSVNNTQPARRADQSRIMAKGGLKMETRGGVERDPRGRERI